ncbi:hypothetical protein ACQ4PT_043780 [Festuca glaucescens]
MVKSTAAAILLLLPLLAVCASSSSSSSHRGQEQDRSALLQLKNALPSAELLHRWSGDSAGTDHCSWPGVTYDAKSRVVALHVPSSSPLSRPGSGIAGELPPSVGLLTELKELSLPSRGLFGEIPAEIWGLEKLEVVNLAGNSLQGALPAAFPRRLRVLNLASNALHGEIPASLCSCTDLERLDLSSNQFNGTVPEVHDAPTALLLPRRCSSRRPAPPVCRPLCARGNSGAIRWEEDKGGGGRS